MIDEYVPTNSMGPIFYRVEIGSTAHGFGIPSQEDIDHMAVALPNPFEWCKVDSKPQESFSYRPGRGPSDPSEPGDLDLMIHGARKFLSLAYNGNPSILNCFFGPIIESSELGDELREIGHSGALISGTAKSAYCGYIHQQRKKLFRPPASRYHLVLQHGYDTKYMTHMARLAIQGFEFLTTGKINMPMVEPYLSDLKSMRQGGFTLEQAISYVGEFEKRLFAIENLPARANPVPINDFLAKIYSTAGVNRG